MGRVRRYKKVKAIDPFSKRKTAKVNDKDRNLPPDVKNHQAQRLNNLQENGKSKKAKRRLPQWAHEELMETAKRVREEHDDSEGKNRRQPEPQRPTIEGKREDESMREFNKRVKQGTAQLLRDQFLEHSTTNKRRKQYLDDKKRKNKLKKQGLWEGVKRREHLDKEGAEEEEIFGTTSGGGGGGGQGGAKGRGMARGRADDEEGVSFADSERIKFGEVAHAPPDLAKIPKPKGFKDQGQAKPWARQQQHKHNRNADKKSKGEDDGGGGGGGMPGRNVRGGEAAGEAAKAQKRQMEEMRQRVLEAYSSMKKRRRAGQTQFVGSDL